MTLHRWLNGFSRFLPDASSCMTTLEERGRTLENRESMRKQLKDQQIMIYHDNTLKELADVPPFIGFIGYMKLYDAVVPSWFLFCSQTHQGKFCTSPPLAPGSTEGPGRGPAGAEVLGRLLGMVSEGGAKAAERCSVLDGIFGWIPNHGFPC